MDRSGLLGMLTTPCAASPCPAQPKHPHAQCTPPFPIPRNCWPTICLADFSQAGAWSSSLAQGTRTQHQDLEFLPEGAANLLDSTLHTQVLTQTLNVEQGHDIILINPKESQKLVKASPVLLWQLTKIVSCKKNLTILFLTLCFKSWTWGDTARAAK